MWWPPKSALAGSIAVLSLVGLLVFGAYRLRPFGGPLTALHPSASPPAASSSPSALRGNPVIAPNAAASQPASSSLVAGAATSLPPPAPSANPEVGPSASALPALTIASAAIPTSAPTPGSTQTPLNEAIAKSLVERYYAAIDARDFATAYRLVGGQWRQRQSYHDFAAGYRTTVRDTASVIGTAAATKDGLRGYVVALNLDAQVAGRLQRYKGLYFVALEDGQPRIQSGELSSQ